MTRFYTKKGDDGYTSLLGEGRVPKYDQRIEAVGVIDEANAAISLARALSISPATSRILFEVQKDLYHLMSEVAATPENAPRFRKITSERVDWLEACFDEISSKVIVPDKFIIPGDSTAGAAIDLARTVIRRAERQLASLYHSKKLENQEILRYINRVSSLCFVLELLENQTAGHINPTLAEQ
jgi:cob(I)alamin adenosyltransferase